MLLKIFLINCPCPIDGSSFGDGFKLYGFFDGSIKYPWSQMNFFIRGSSWFNFIGSPDITSIIGISMWSAIFISNYIKISILYQCGLQLPESTDLFNEKFAVYFGTDLKIKITNVIAIKVRKRYFWWWWWWEGVVIFVDILIIKIYFYQAE